MPASMTRPIHVPVMLEEVLATLEPRPGGVYVDATIGGGGHAAAIAARMAGEGLLIGLDRDPAAIEATDAMELGVPRRLAQANYCDLPEVLEELGITAVDGVLLDLGLSSDQLADATRGFSFSADGPLDLRFDPTEGEPAWRLVNRLSAKSLADLIFQYGEERHSRRIAEAIVTRRRRQPIRTSGELAELIRRTVRPSADTRRIHPATRTFQALRMAVNEEPKSLRLALARLPECLRSGGRLAIISFHSLEDRLVKEAFRDDERLVEVARRPLRPAPEEVDRNPRARSARLRAAQRR